MFQVNVEGAGKLQDVIQKMLAEAQSFDAALPVIAELLVGAVNDVVDMEGPGWPELSPVTLARRRKNGRGARMLRDTNIMMESLFTSYGSDFAEVTFGVPYAIHHVKGRRNPLNIAPVEQGLIDDVTETLLGGL